MTDPFEKVSAGQPLEIPARAWNQILTSAQTFQRTKLGTPGEVPIDFPVDPANTAMAQNATGTVLPSFSVLCYSDPIVDPAITQLDSQKRPAFKADVPVSESDPFVITWASLGPNDVGRVITSGYAVVQVDVSNLAHRKARPIAGNTANLKSVSDNGVPILAPKTFTEFGVQWCGVLLAGSTGGCCPEDSPSFTIPLGCSISGSGAGSGSGSGSGGGSTFCVFGIDVCADDDAIWTPFPGSGIPPKFGQFRLTGAAKASALAACKGGAIFYLFGKCGNDLIGGSFSESMCIVLFNGQDSYSDLLAPVTLNSVFDGTGFPISNVTGEVTITGRMVLCPSAAVPGWYFDGQITSTAADPSKPGQYDCGCLTSVTGCGGDQNSVTQSIISGPTFSPLFELDRVATDCGRVDIRLALCSVPPPSPPPPPPPPTACNACTLLGIRPTLIIADGPDVGNWVADFAWATGSTTYGGISGFLTNEIVTMFTRPGDTSGPFAIAVCDPTFGLVTLGASTSYPGGGTSIVGTSTCGTPTIMAFTDIGDPNFFGGTTQAVQVVT